MDSASPTLPGAGVEKNFQPGICKLMQCNRPDGDGVLRREEGGVGLPLSHEHPTFQARSGFQHNHQDPNGVLLVLCRVTAPDSRLCPNHPGGPCPAHSSLHLPALPCPGPSLAAGFCRVLATGFYSGRGGQEVCHPGRASWAHLPSPVVLKAWGGWVGTLIIPGPREPQPPELLLAGHPHLPQLPSPPFRCIPSSLGGRRAGSRQGPSGMREASIFAMGACAVRQAGPTGSPSGNASWVGGDSEW